MAAKIISFGRVQKESITPAEVDTLKKTLVPRGSTAPGYAPPKPVSPLQVKKPARPVGKPMPKLHGAPDKPSNVPDVEGEWSDYQRMEAARR